MPLTAELIQMTAREAVDLLRKRAISPSEMLEASIARIDATDGQINALPLKAYERAREQAARLEELWRGKTADHPGWLAGLPIAIKDLTDVGGVATTYGCPLYADNVPQKSDPHVARLEQRGALIVAKSNTPELGMLPVTENRLFGATRNPWSTDLSPGGSSGGAGAALAVGQVWLADGSDIGGSLRIPAALSGVVGFRPSPGVVPRAHQKRIFNPLAVLGPMARTVADCALFLDALAGQYPADALTLRAPADPYLHSVDRARAPLKVAFAADLGFGGIEPEVAEIAQAAALRLESVGTIVEPARPDFGGVDRAYGLLLGFAFASQRGEFVKANAAQMPLHVLATVQAAEAAKATDLIWAEQRRADLWAEMCRFFETHEFLLTPTIGRAAVPVDEFASDGGAMGRWAAGELPGWFHPCWATVPTALPAISIPCGFTRAGLPVGLQIIGPGRADAAVLAAAAVLEALLALPTKRPIDPRPPAMI